MPADPSQPACGISGERFDTFWDDATNSWRYHDAASLDAEQAEKCAPNSIFGLCFGLCVVASVFLQSEFSFQLCNVHTWVRLVHCSRVNAAITMGKAICMSHACRYGLAEGTLVKVSCLDPVGKTSIEGATQTLAAAEGEGTADEVAAAASAMITDPQTKVLFQSHMKDLVCSEHI